MLKVSGTVYTLFPLEKDDELRLIFIRWNETPCGFASFMQDLGLDEASVVDPESSGHYYIIEDEQVTGIFVPEDADPEEVSRTIELELGGIVEIHSDKNTCEVYRLLAVEHSDAIDPLDMGGHPVLFCGCDSDEECDEGSCPQPFLISHN